MIFLSNYFDSLWLTFELLLIPILWASFPIDFLVNSFWFLLISVLLCLQNHTYVYVYTPCTNSQVGMVLVHVRKVIEGLQPFKQTPKDILSSFD